MLNFISISLTFLLFLHDRNDVDVHLLRIIIPYHYFRLHSVRSIDTRRPLYMVCVLHLPVSAVI